MIFIIIAINADKHIFSDPDIKNRKNNIRILRKLSKDNIIINISDKKHISDNLIKNFITRLRTKNLCRKHNIEFDYIIFCENAKDRSELYKNYKIDYIIEDDPDIINNSDRNKIIVLTNKTNKHIPGIRISKIADLENLLFRLSKNIQ